MDLLSKVRRGDYVVLPGKDVLKRYASSSAGSRRSSRASTSSTSFVSTAEDAHALQKKYEFLDAVTDDEEETVFEMLSNEASLSSETLDSAFCAACCRNQIGWVRRIGSDSRLLHGGTVLQDGRALACCAYYGSVECAEYLLCEMHVDPCAGDLFAVEMAAEQGHLSILKLLFASEEFQEHVKQDYTSGSRLSSDAVATRHASSASSVQSDPGEDCAVSARSGSPSMHTIGTATSGSHVPVRWNRIWRAAVYNRQNAVVEFLLNAGDRNGASVSVPVDDELLTGAAETGNLQLLELSLTHPRCLEAFQSNRGVLVSEALACAANADQSEAVARLLLESDCDPEWNGLQAVRDAIQGTCFASLSRLLADPRVDPSAVDNCALRAAVDLGDRDTINLIVQHPRFDASHAVTAIVDMCVIRHDYDTLDAVLSHHSVPSDSVPSLLRRAVRSACVFGTRRALEELSEDSRMSKSDAQVVRLQCACWKGDVETVEELLEDVSIDPGADRSECLVFACAQGHAQIVERLLRDPRVDPSCGGSNEALARACMAGDRHIHIVRLLLKDPRVDPSIRNNKAWRAACRAFPAEEVKRLLLEDERVNRLVEDGDSDDEYSDSEEFAVC